MKCGQCFKYYLKVVHVQYYKCKYGHRLEFKGQVILFKTNKLKVHNTFNWETFTGAVAQIRDTTASTSKIQHGNGQGFKNILIKNAMP